jgi:hypothetical protein
MKHRIQISICASLSFLLLINSAPATNTNLLNDINLAKFNKTFLNRSSWNFLDECNVKETLTCSLYYDMLLNLAAVNNSEQITNDQFKQKIEQLNKGADTFCVNFLATIPKTSKFNVTKDKVAKIAEFMGKPVFCSSMCTQLDMVEMSLTVKPICGIIYLGYQMLANISVPIAVVPLNTSVPGSISPIPDIPIAVPKAPAETIKKNDVEGKITCYFFSSSM